MFNVEKPLRADVRIVLQNIYGYLKTYFENSWHLSCNRSQLWQNLIRTREPQVGMASLRIVVLVAGPSESLVSSVRSFVHQRVLSVLNQKIEKSPNSREKYCLQSRSSKKAIDYRI